MILHFIDLSFIVSDLFSIIRTSLDSEKAQGATIKHNPLSSNSLRFLVRLFFFFELHTSALF